MRWRNWSGRGGSPSSKSCSVESAFIGSDAGHSVLLTAHEFQETEERFASRANRKNQEYGKNCEKDAAPAKGGGEAGADFGTLNYSERLNVAITGNKTMKVAILAINQRTYRAIVSFTAE